MKKMIKETKYIGKSGKKMAYIKIDDDQLNEII
jgi:hypothetical protein